MTTHHTIRRPLLASALTLSLVLAACGSDDASAPAATVGPTTTAAPSSANSAPAASAAADTTTAQTAPNESGSLTTDPALTNSASEPGSAPSGSTGQESAEWQKIVAAAEDEGKVTIYSAQATNNLNEFAARFSEKYPDIEIEAIRLTDGESTPKVEIEKQSGQRFADMWVIYSASTVEAKVAEGGWFVEPAGPNFSEEGGYLPEYLHDGGYFEAGAAVLTFGWNTDIYPEGVDDYTDLLDPALGGGKIATIDASVSPSAVDFYYFLEDTYGQDFLEQFGAQEPRLYPSAVPIGEALGSGEVAVAAFTLPLTAQIEAGAPVEFALAEQSWGTRAYASILDGAPHPNAAQVLADFMVSAEGQAAIAKDQSAVRPDVPDTLTTNDRVRVQDLAELTPEKVQAYLVEWDKLFR